MTRNLINNLTVEEVNMVLLCSAKDKEGIAKELQSYLNMARPDMSEIIHHTIEKVHDLTDEELTEVLNYPSEN